MYMAFLYNTPQPTIDPKNTSHSTSLPLKHHGDWKTDRFVKLPGWLKAKLYWEAHGS